jgi:CRISPR-associated protein Cmr3
MKLITLKPLMPFFFGYENTFGKKGTNYYVRSALFPQQTTILGMLRREILIQAGLLTRKLRDEWVDLDKSEVAKELVGSGKFKSFEEEIDIGVIKSISPVFLKKGKKYYFRMPNIKGIKNKKGYYLVDFEEGYKNFGFILKDLEGNKERLFYDNESKKGAFIESEMVGNSLKDNEDAFFKKIVYDLNNFEFAFYADIDFELKNSVVKLGADNSLFKMKVEEVSDSFEDIEFKKKNFLECEENVSIVLGDSYIENLDSDFGVVDEVVFRTFKQTKSFKKYKPIKLYQKGTIFVNLRNKLKNNFAQKIGFNYIKEMR